MRIINSLQSVCKSFNLKKKYVAQIKVVVSLGGQEQLTHAFIFSRMDYCNGLLTDPPKKTIKQLQLIQNTAARVFAPHQKNRTHYSSFKIFTLASS